MLTQRLKKGRLLAVVTLDRADDALPLADALLAGGLDIMEITLRTTDALEGVRRIAAGRPEMFIGAGTVICPTQVDEILEAGAQFGVAPGISEPVVSAAMAKDLPFIPGVMTPSDIEKSLAMGCKLLKFFPAQPAGGVKTLKAIAAPYAHTGMQFVPLGGVNMENAADYLALPTVAGIGGSWLTDPALMADGDWQAISNRVRDALALTASS